MKWLIRDVGSAILLAIPVMVSDSISAFYVNQLGGEIQRYMVTPVMI